MTNELCLANLVTRPGVSLYLTTERQIKDREYEIVVADRKSARAIIEDWRLISLHRHDTDESVVYLIGHVRDTYKTRVTSPVAQIDLANGLVVTQNSFYALGERGKGEPSLRQLLAIIYVFYAWGIGAALGMPWIVIGGNE
jgi:hypothetical protein